MYKPMAWALFWIGLFIVGLGAQNASAASVRQDDSKAQWAKVVSAAQQEGKVVIYGASGVDRINVFKDHFEARFPGIRVDYVVGGSSQLRARLMAERRASKHIPDLYMSGGSTLFRSLRNKNAFKPMRSAMIQPEVLDQSKWFEGKHWYADKGGKYMLIYSLAVTTNIAVNTDMVNPKTITSYQQLLDPKWRGKIVSQDVRKAGPGSGNIKYLYSHPDLGADYLRRLYGEMKITMSRDRRQMVDWLAHGRYAIYLFPTLNGVDQARSVGLPVDVVNPQQMKEGYAVTSGFNNLLLLNPAPHPNAAKVYVNWLLSRDGQTKFEKVIKTPSLRTDTPTKSALRDFLVPKERAYSMVVSLEKYWNLDKKTRPLLIQVTKSRTR